jgi:hypothetical protein
MSDKLDQLLECSCRKHTQEIVDYILRGPGKKRVPDRIYNAAWELEFALKRELKEEGSK